MRWKRLIKNGKNYISLLYIKWSAIKPVPKLNNRATKSIAVGLQHQMYQAFAAGDVATIREICAEGLRDNLIASINARAKGEVMQWEVVKEKSSKVVSHLATPLFGKNTALRQAVVEIRSVQKLTSWDSRGQVIPETGGEKDVTEYVVIQKKYWGGVEAPWMIWGTTKETSLADMNRMAKEQQERAAGEA